MMQRSFQYAAVLAACFVVSACRELAAGETYTVQLDKQEWPLHTQGGKVQRKSAYYGKVSLGGDKPQLMEVVFDTGSGHLVIPSIMCMSDVCRKKRRYRRKASLTGLDINVDYPSNPVLPGAPRDQLSIAYGTGAVKGVLVRDYTCLGPHEAPDFKSVSLLQTKAAYVGNNVANKTKVLEEEEGDAVTPPPAAAEQQPLQPPDADGAPSLGTPSVGLLNTPLSRHAAVEAIVDRVGAAGCVDFQFIVATEISENPFASYQFDGVLGLGLAGLATNPQFSFMHVASTNGAWTGMPGFQKAFTVFLGWHPDETSEITFGGWDKNHVEANELFTWHNVLESSLGYWQVKIDEVWSNGTRLDFCDDGTCRAIVDTGTSLLGFPRLLGRQLIRQLRHEDPGNAACNGEMPELSFVIGNRTIVMRPEDMARPEIASDPTYAGARRNASLGQQLVDPTGAGGQLNMLQLAENTTQMCIPMIMFVDLPEPISPKMIIFGEPVIQKYYTSFDTNPEQPRIGFARAHHTWPRKPLDFLGMVSPKPAI